MWDACPYNMKKKLIYGIDLAEVRRKKAAPAMLGWLDERDHTGSKRMGRTSICPSQNYSAMA